MPSWQWWHVVARRHVVPLAPEKLARLQGRERAATSSPSRATHRREGSSSSAMSSRVAGPAVLLRHLGRRIFSSPVSPASPVAAQRPLLSGGEGAVWARLRLLSTSAAEEAAKEEAAASKENSASTAAAKAEAAQAAKDGDKTVVSSYWGIVPAKLVNKDGAEWKWSCFRPWEAYTSDTTIDLKKHHEPKVLLDKIAYWTVKSLRVPTDIFFQRRYGCRAMMLETVAAVPGMVGGMLLHLRSLRRFEHSGGWIRALLEEAENERMHLMTFMEVAGPKWYERALVLAVQGVFFNAYFLGYLLSPKFAHRVVGYLEEEAVHSYTEFLRDIEAGKIDNVPAPRIAIDYWRLPPDATLRDVVVVVRADEAHHRDVNHFASGWSSTRRLPRSDTTDD
ncbi:hypothetical protein BRADI_3g52505v3 [Brachypodium distachyon]|uniref:Ubiquinol oxidase n=1 Tax=Brachypodium distachyon TaxID=15368 RepID=A0A2K2D4R3_BRADI|nr:hypothetical protein BRADI_3g52505v3 [Brachypodium distachyon]